jgi:hypothetical protein
VFVNLVRALLPAAALASLACGCGGGDADPVVVHGRVFDHAEPVWSATVSLYAGPLRSIYGGGVKRVYTTQSDDAGRFQLRAARGDEAPAATDFFVFVTHKASRTAFLEVCAYVALPRVTLGEVDGRDAWIDVTTGRQVPPLEIASASEGDC